MRKNPNIIARYCKDCSIKVHGRDEQDFAGFVTDEEEAMNMLMLVDCHGCGKIYVGTHGQRIRFAVNQGV